MNMMGYLDVIAVLQVLDYSGGHTLDDLIEYVEKQKAGVSDEDDDESDSDDSDDEGEEPEVPKVAMSDHFLNV